MCLNGYIPLLNGYDGKNQVFISGVYALFPFGSKCCHGLLSHLEL